MSNDILTMLSNATTVETKASTEAYSGTGIRLLPSAQSNVYSSSKYYIPSKKLLNKYKGQSCDAQLLINEDDPRSMAAKLVVTIGDETKQVTLQPKALGRVKQRMTHTVKFDDQNLVLYFNNDDIVVKNDDAEVEIDLKKFNF